jgi:hypothetical protein
VKGVYRIVFFIDYYLSISVMDCSMVEIEPSSPRLFCSSPMENISEIETQFLKPLVGSLLSQGF